MGGFLVAQNMVLSHRAKFQLIIDFFLVSTYFVVFLPEYYLGDVISTEGGVQEAVTSRLDRYGKNLKRF